MKGIYCLLIKVLKTKEILIGRLGKIKFEKGKYIYVGSAQKNLGKRIERHFKKEKKKYWHIDYLLKDKDVKIEKAILFPFKRKNQECKLAKQISKKGKAIENFGSSDCKCKSHLIKI
ncbi:MAG: GIY-YIG nuclease family protein [Candidatus Nealsonbacteria bacterium]|nr:MAG: GIY-YIG nuclease family protein [Candidatus Nealsonbacteria bacterium]